MENNVVLEFKKKILMREINFHQDRIDSLKQEWINLFEINNENITKFTLKDSILKILQMGVKLRCRELHKLSIPLYKKEMEIKNFSSKLSIYYNEGIIDKEGKGKYTLYFIKEK